MGTETTKGSWSRVTDRNAYRNSPLWENIERTRSGKEAEQSLVNWGRYVRDQWPLPELGYTPPPTSEQYRAPVVAYDEPEPALEPIDHQDAIISEHVVISIGCTAGEFEYFRVLVHWYTKLLFQLCDGEERLRRLTKFMGFSKQNEYAVARQMLDRARVIFGERKHILDELKKECRIVGGP